MIDKVRFEREFRKAWPKVHGRTVKFPKHYKIKLLEVARVAGIYELTMFKGAPSLGIKLNLYSDQKREVHRYILDSQLLIVDYTVEHLGPKPLSIYGNGGGDPRRFEGKNDRFGG